MDHRVDYDNQNRSCDNSDGVISKFGIEKVSSKDYIVVLKDPLGQVETDAMLSFVDLRLSNIPFEAQHVR